MQFCSTMAHQNCLHFCIQTMAVLIDPVNWLSLAPSVVVFDLEFVGDITDPLNCHLWEIGAVHLVSGDLFHVIVDPQLSTIPTAIPGCFDLTQKFLNESAVPLAEGLNRFTNWMQKYRLLISHNGFKSDMAVLQGSYLRCNLKLPPWLFLDSLLILRQQVKLNNYKLQTIYHHFCRSSMKESHRALPDAVALKQVLYVSGGLPHRTFAYPMGFTPLQNIKGIGYACETVLFWRGILSVEQLILKVKSLHAHRWLWTRVKMLDTVLRFLLQCQLPLHNLVPLQQEILWHINGKPECCTE